VRFEVSDQMSFAHAYQNLTAGGVKVTTIDHMVCWAMYFTDPDGNGIGIFWDTRALPDRPLLWQGRDLPLGPEKILAVLKAEVRSSACHLSLNILYSPWSRVIIFVADGVCLTVHKSGRAAAAVPGKPIPKRRDWRDWH
jgi:hypothetical protein